MPEPYIVDQLIIAMRKIPESALVADLKHDETLADWFRESGLEGETFRQYIDVYLGERWDDIVEGLRGALVQDEKLVIYRCIEHPDPERLVKQIVAGRGHDSGYGNRLGIFWTWDRDAAKCHWGTGSGKELILTGLVALSSIDTKMTLLANLNPSNGLEEREIRLWDGKPVTLVEACVRRPWNGTERPERCIPIDQVKRKA